MSRGYQSIPRLPTVDPRGAAAAPPQPHSHHHNGWWWNFLAGGELNADEKAKLRTRLEGIESEEHFCVHAESLRIMAFCAFVAMLALSYTLSSLLLEPEVIEDSDLIHMLGYNNICVFWDYSPSREYVAMLYPLFEYSFFFYVIFDYIHLRLVCQKDDWVWLMRLGNFLFPIKLVLIAWFRMIFVYAVNQPAVNYGVRGIVGHTLAFFGLQIALGLSALEHVMFIEETKIDYPLLARLFGAGSTGRLGWFYLACALPTSIFQIVYISGRFWGFHFVDSKSFLVRFMDRAWMFLFAFLPVWFAFVGRKTQAHVKISFSLDTAAWAEGRPALIARSRSQRSDRLLARMRSEGSFSDAGLATG